MSDYYRCTCGNHLEKVTQSANSMLNSEQFDAARMGDWFCRRCPKNEGKNRYFWDSEVAALAAAPAQPVAEPAEVSAVESNTAGAAIAAGAVYAELPMQFACSGVFPVYSADQMRAFADGTHALRTKSEASREFLERMLSAMEGVIDVADRKTAEFDALRSCVVDLTLMLFKPEALRASRGQAPAQAAPAYKDSTPELHIGDSAFESWYSTYSPAHKSDKQRVRDAYAAGMGDPLVVAAPTPQADSQPAQVLVYPPLPEPFIGVQNQPWGGHAEVIRSAIGEDGVIPCFTAGQMVADADATHAARAQAYIAPAGGLVSVPSEPTAEMYRAAQTFVYSTGEDGGSIVLNTSQVRALWQAMRAAAASTAVSVSEPVFAFRRKGLDDFCTCTEKRYAELSAKPNLFETRIFYTTPPTQAADSVLEDAETALRKVLGVVQRYLPPDGPSAHDAMSEIIAIVDPWPLGPLEKP